MATLIARAPSPITTQARAPAATGSQWDWQHLLPFAAWLFSGLAVWFLPPPAGVDIKAWHLLAIFVATIVGFIAKPLPMGAVAMVGIAMTTLTGTLRVADSLSGFADSTIWLIVLAFFIARGFIKTGLAERIAYLFVAALGRKTLGLAYGLIATDGVLATAVPSNTARAGGVVFPILTGISKAYGSEPSDGTGRKIGSFLTLASFQGTIITSAMFLTAMAANPLAAKLAGDAGITITWTKWAQAAIVPGLVSLLVVPWLIYKLYPPEIKETPGAAQFAKDRLREKGGMQAREWVMLATFILLLVLWIFGPQLGALETTSAALIGLGILLITQVLSWDDVKRETGAWDTLVWFSALVMMASFLNKLGLIPWFSKAVGARVAGVDWMIAFGVLSLVYFYSHYMFASNTAHVGAMYPAFLAVALAVGTPPLLAALVLAFFSNLFSSMTHYGTGPAPIMFGAGYVGIGTWWKMGALISVVNIVIWLGIGGAVWKVMGLW
jgi:divalent anion:Na+ symporter, DASS family